MFLTSCYGFRTKTEKKYFAFNTNKENVKIIEYNVLKDSFSLNTDKRLRKVELFVTDTSMLIVASEVHTNNIIVFDLINDTAKTISFKVKYPYPIDFGYINQDSIFLIYSSAEDYRGYHDSLIYLGNSKGEIIKCYTLKDAPVLTKENPQELSRDKENFLTNNVYEPLTYKDNKLFLHFDAQANVLGDSVVSKNLIAGYIDTKENKFYPINITYPDIEFGKNFFNASDKAFFSTFAHDGDLLYAFKYTPTIIKYNYKTGKSQEVQIKSRVFDTIYPSLSEKDVPKGLDFELPYPKYYTLLYDKYRHLYYRFVLLPREYGKLSFYVIVADTNFNVIAEGFPFSEHQHNFYSTDKYFIYGQTYEMIFKDGNNQMLISQIKDKNLNRKRINKSLTHYMKSYAKAKDYTAVIMWQKGSCDKTMNFMLGFFQANETKFERDKVFLVIVGEDVVKIRNELKNHNLLSVNHTNIFIDSTLEYGAYNNYEVHSLPRIIKVRNKIIKADTMISGYDGGVGLQNFIINSAKEQ